jgi:hypothetical protein
MNLYSLLVGVCEAALTVPLVDFLGRIVETIVVIINKITTYNVERGKDLFVVIFVVHIGTAVYKYSIM